MKSAHPLLSRSLAAALACACVTPLRALIVNGGFESGLAGWTRVDQLGSEGTFFLQSGTTSPVNGFAVPAPPSGTNAAMTDAAGPGSHVLYQDFVVAGGLTSYTLSFSVFINNDNGAGAFFTPATLDFATPTLNQRARVDIMTATSNPFSLAAADVLANVYQTNVGNPLRSGYTTVTADISALLQANQGATLRLRFAEVDNVAPFNMGVDNVNIQVGTSTPVPDSLPVYVPWITTLALLGAAAVRRRRN